MQEKNCKIKKVVGRKVFDSQGFATIEVEITLDNGIKSYASVPRGSTTGNFETTYIENYIYGHGKTPDVTKAINNVNTIIAPALIGKKFDNIYDFDKLLISLDSDEYKKTIGGNCTLATSYAMLKLLSKVKNKPIFSLLSKEKSNNVLPMFNMIDGYKHPKSLLKGVEILLIPENGVWKNIGELFEKVSLINCELNDILIKNNYIVSISNQGALSALIKSVEDGMSYLKMAVEKEGFKLGDEFTIGLDLAVSDYYDEIKNKYHIPWAIDCEDSDQLIKLYLDWVNNYTVSYIEDGLADKDYVGWEKIMKYLGNQIMISGDDLLATNIHRLEKCKNLCNMAVVKPNQIGTIFETVEFIKNAKSYNKKMLVSQRTGETEDVIISHLAYAFQLSYLKAGGVQRMDRVAKFNELIRIED